MKTSTESTENIEFFHMGSMSLEYSRRGKGEKTLIALHGFGRTQADFKEFTQPLEEDYTIFAVNIFFHGNSTIHDRKPDAEPLSILEFKSLFGAFLAAIHVEKCDLLGYSLGGRLAMKIAEVMPNRVNKLFLFAPDGLILNRWYALLSHRPFGRWLFRLFIKNNELFNILLQILHKTRFISTRLKEFIENQTKSKSDQEKVYNVWTFLRRIEPDFKKLGRSLDIEEIPCTVFIGAYDRIIPLKNTKKIKKCSKMVKVELVRAGHKLLKRSIAEELLADGRWVLD